MRLELEVEPARISGNGCGDGGVRSRAPQTFVEGAACRGECQL